MSTEKRNEVETLGKGLRLLCAFSEERDQLTLAGLSRMVDIPKPTALRMLRTLEDYGFVSRDGQVYRIGAQCLLLGSLYRVQEELRIQSKPVMKELMEATNEIVQLGVLHDQQVLYLERLEPQRAVTLIMSRPGSMLPAHCTGLGKSMLAFSSDQQIKEYFAATELVPRTAATITDHKDLLAELEKVRERGYAIDEREYDDEIKCMAAPIFRDGKKIIASLSVAAPSFRRPALGWEETGRLVKEAANRISLSQVGAPGVEASKEIASGRGLSVGRR